jgi:hypothetical protein
MMEWELVGKTEVLEETSSQCHSVHYESHMTWAGMETGRAAAVESRWYENLGAVYTLVKIRTQI